MGTVGVCFWAAPLSFIRTHFYQLPNSKASCEKLQQNSAMAFAAPKKDGGPNLKFYEAHETLQLFEGIKTWLNKNCKKVFDNTALSYMASFVLSESMDCNTTGIFF